MKAMDQPAIALGPVFVAGFAVQQFLEIATAGLDINQHATFQKYKKIILGLASLTVGLLLAGWVREFRVFQAVNVNTNGKEWLNVIVSGFVLSAGTEGVNSILKFFKYSKEDKKTTAASKDPSGGLEANLEAGVPTAAALQSMNLK
jgi:hypothetical protein